MATPETKHDSIHRPSSETIKATRVETFYRELHQGFVSYTNQCIRDGLLELRTEAELSNPQEYIQRMRRKYHLPHQILWINALTFLSTHFAPRKDDEAKAAVYPEKLFVRFPGLREVGGDAVRHALLSEEKMIELLNLTSQLHSDLVLALQELEIGLDLIDRIMIERFADSRGLNEIPEDDYQELIRGGQRAKLRAMIHDFRRAIAPTDGLVELIEAQFPAFVLPIGRFVNASAEVEIPYEILFEICDAARELPETAYVPAIHVPKDAKDPNNTNAPKPHSFIR